MAYTREELIKRLITTMIWAIPKDLSDLQVRYWSDGDQELADLLTRAMSSACTSEWWQMVIAAKIFVGSKQMRNFNEKQFPLDPATETPDMVYKSDLLGGFTSRFDDVLELLKKRNQQPATLRQVLIHLANNDTTLWDNTESEDGDPTLVVIRDPQYHIAVHYAAFRPYEKTRKEYIWNPDEEPTEGETLEVYTQTCGVTVHPTANIFVTDL